MCKTLKPDPTGSRPPSGLHAALTQGGLTSAPLSDLHYNPAHNTPTVLQVPAHAIVQYCRHETAEA